MKNEEKEKGGGEKIEVRKKENKNDERKIKLTEEVIRKKKARRERES